ncbi:MAG: type III-A CRISPR-associated protein Cas10/Csm1 [Methanobrevibacter sp.]|jgi:CRISPR-associated protein Csm1|nr:type III-A CRISPR-associated protein Cas10/Csm1 [Candidatus Methanovirga australis]
MGELDIDLKTIEIAALLHDIGKFYQRTGTVLKHSKFKKLNKNDFGQNGAHGKWSATFINEILGDEGSLIEDLVLYHHNSSKSKFKEMTDIIRIADQHSSAERDKLGDKKKQEVSKEPLISVFSRVCLKDEKNQEYRFPLKKLGINDNELYPKYKKEEAIDGWKLDPEYNNLWNEFKKELEKIPNKDFNTLLALMKKYTSTMPSAAYIDVPDISLYDHSKTTAAIAICRYLFSKDDKLYISDNKGNELNKDTQDVYLAIKCDISGIQKFIYKVSSPQEAQSGMSKRLRGRSLYISLLNDSVATKIIEELFLSSANILYCGGGSFTIIAPNTEKVKNKLSEIKKEINEFFIDKFNAELYLALAIKTCSGKDLGNFGKITKSLSDDLSTDKKHKFAESLDKIFKEEKIHYTKLCPVCGNGIENINENNVVDDNRLSVCEDCRKQENLGKNSANSEYMIKIFDKNKIDINSISPDFYEESLNVAYIFKKSEKEVKKLINELNNKYSKIEVIRLNDTNFLVDGLLDIDNVSFSFNFLGNTVPTYDKPLYGPLYFQHLAEISRGANKIGILKMDVDNLGKIFSQGFNCSKDNENVSEGDRKSIENDNKTSISRISTLSSQLDMFFSGFINSIAKKYKVYSDVCPECKDKIEEITLKIQSDEDLDDETSEETFAVYRGKYDEVCSECENYSIPTIHINYSGGDDLLAIGPYDDIMEFAKEFREEFRKWTCYNPSITLSGGIAIIHPKFPIGKATLIADEYLEASKNCGEDKDKITVFNETVKWDGSNLSRGYNDLLDYGKKLEKYVNEDYLSNGMIYSMLNLWKNSFSIETKLFNNKEDWCNDICNNRCRKRKYIPLYYYKLKRSIKNDKKGRDIIEELSKDGIKFMPWIPIPASWVSLRNR